jgi:uncharacterized protein YbjT (DUF2867 family)
MRVLVTGGTGTLGSAVVDQLRQRGHEAVVGSRTSGAGRVVINLATGDGIERAVVNVEAVVHTASDPGRHARTTDVVGTRRLAETGLPVLYTSIVGIDGHPYRYYRIKREGEQALEVSSQNWTVLRATQFHVFVDRLLAMSKSAAGRVPTNGGRDARFPSSKDWWLQPVSHHEVACRIVDLVDAGPTNSIEQFAGPEQFVSRDLARSWAEARGGRPFWMPTFGRISRAFKDGSALAGPEVTTGVTSWTDYLSETD